MAAPNESNQRPGGVIFAALFLLASVLNAFLPLYTSVNSFTELTLTNRNIEGDTYTWPPSHGAIQLL